MCGIPREAALIFMRGTWLEFSPAAALVQSCVDAGCLGESETLFQGLCPVVPLLPGKSSSIYFAWSLVQEKERMGLMLEPGNR